MASNRFKERVKYRRYIMAVSSILGFFIVMGMGITFFVMLPVQLDGDIQKTSIIIGVVIQTIFSFSLAWVLRSLYFNNIDVVISKMEHYEMKVLKGIIDHEIEKEEKARADKIKDDEESKKFQRAGGKK